MKKGINNFRSQSMLVMGTLILSLAVVTSSCEGTATDNTDNPVTNQDTLVDEIGNNVSYQVPTPNELFSIIKDVNISFDAGVLNDPANSDKYTTKKTQALNFGVYSADLAFAASFDAGNESLKYFSVIKNIGDVLNVNNAFDQTVFDRIEKNIQEGQSDSLFKLSDETYYNAYSYLEENKRGTTLALIVLGGWVESLYIMMNLGEFEEGNALSSSIADQKLTLENLLQFMSDYQDDDEVMEMMESLVDLEVIFSELDQSDFEEVSTSLEGDVTMFEGGSDLVLSEEKFVELKEAVNALRTSIVE